MSQTTSRANKRAVAEQLLRIGAVFLRPDEPFTWASGIKSPIYCDNRLILSDVQARQIVEHELAVALRENFPEAEMVMGTATAGIPHAALVADELNMTMGYVRGSAKSHGRQKRIEGALQPHAKVVVIEDLISTGGSSIECAQALKEEGAEVLGILSIFSYSLKEAEENFKKYAIHCIPVLTLDDLLDVAQDQGLINKTGRKKLETFRDNPHDEAWMKVSTHE